MNKLEYLEYLYEKYRISDKNAVASSYYLLPKIRYDHLMVMYEDIDPLIANQEIIDKKYFQIDLKNGYKQTILLEEFYILPITDEIKQLNYDPNN